MSGTPELDRVADARRKLAAHAGFPRSYWVVYGLVLVLSAGLPVWVSYLPSDGWVYVSWAIAVLGVGSAVYAMVRRRRSGVYLSRRISAYPTAHRIWLAGLVVTFGGFVGIQQLVEHGHRDIALYVLAPLAVVVFVAQVATRSAMRADIEAGRVTS
ncbi:hypothetical protein [Pseudonocardia kunmingensis]|uniref:Uncharacterized protein n=1 Tax=Pseudonocardia kunmingensis TaxID=630975 RepID=A0A543E2H8_9PSEU|nr:hypothetical protein [Pseudonocardia kunmingensis]TQM15801.1 hypothetical protein FB558_2594 [Pseudonocardia kunmingensis]